MRCVLRALAILRGACRSNGGLSRRFAPHNGSQYDTWLRPTNPAPGWDVHQSSFPAPSRPRDEAQRSGFGSVRKNGEADMEPPRASAAAEWSVPVLTLHPSAFLSGSTGFLFARCVIISSATQKQFIPKHRDLGNVSDEDLSRFAALINLRPRKCLNWATPYEVFSHNLLHFT